MADSDSITRVARKWRKQALACLVQIVLDEGANPSARARAATDILRYSDGTPQRAEALTDTDIEDLTDEQREQIYISLTTYYLRHGFPPAVDRLMQDTIEDAAVSEELYPDVQYPQYQFPTTPPTPAKRIRRVRLNEPDEDFTHEIMSENNTDILPVRRRVRLVDVDSHYTTLHQPSPRLRPVPKLNEYLVDLPHALTVNLPGSRSVQLKQGYSCVTQEIAAHPVIKKFIVHEEAAE